MAFTVGYSLILLLGTFQIALVSKPPIEILISAVHALRPIFPGREFLVAGAFGLVHGLAFATVIAGLGLDRWAMAFGVLSFNFGIEAMQLAVVLATMPWLLLLSTTRAHPAFRIVGAGFAAVAATGRLADRTLGWANPIKSVVDIFASRALWVVAVGSLAAQAT